MDKNLIGQVFVAKLYNPQNIQIDPDTWYAIKLEKDGVSCAELDVYLVGKVREQQRAVEALEKLYKVLSGKGEDNGKSDSSS